MYILHMKRALVLGGGGFIGGHLVNKLVERGYWVRSADIKEHQYSANPHDFVLCDLTIASAMSEVVDLPNGEKFDEIYQLAADMGGAGYIFTGENDANVMLNSSLINLNLLQTLVEQKNKENDFPIIFYSSSACIYPEEKQTNTLNPGLKESDAYPANPDSEYGWEKIFSERLFLAFSRNYKIPVRIARFHNVFGPEGTWRGGKEKAPAAICRKVAEAPNGGTVEIWGDGQQTRSFLYIEDCLKAIEAFMNTEYSGPLNIGSEEMVSIQELVEIVCSFEEKQLQIKNVPGPQGVRGRNSDNSLVREKLNWDASTTLKDGLSQTYNWISSQLAK